MNKSTKILIAVVAFSVVGLIAEAQSASRVLVVDMISLFNEHYKTQEQTTRLQADAEKAKAESERIMKERNALIEEYKELAEQDKNPMTKEAVKEKNRAAAQLKIQDIQRKEGELKDFNTNTQKVLQQRFQTFKKMMFEEISKIATVVAKRKGADLLFDKAGPSVLGIPSLLYSDPSLDITSEVKAEINKGRPASNATPKITVPMGR